MERRKEQSVSGAAPQRPGAAKRSIGRNSMATNRNRRGIALAWSAIVLFVMVGIVGLSIDWGKCVWNVHQLQNAADAGALAGAQALPDGVGEVILRATSIAACNEADTLPVALRQTQQHQPFISTDEKDCDIILGRYFMQFRGTADAWEPNMAHANAVKVIARREEGSNGPDLRLLFGPIFGKDTVPAERAAIALGLGANGAGLICLSGTGTGITTGGGANLLVNGGDIHVNSAQEPCVVNSNNSTIECLGLGLHGTIADATSFDFPVTQHAPMMADPLKDVPDLRPLPGLGTALKWDKNLGKYVDAGVDISGNVIDSSFIIKNGGIDPENPSVTAMLRLTPGYYPKGFRLERADTKLVLLPGVYAVGGNKGASSGLVVTSGTFIARGVMLYVTDDGAGNWGEINLNGSKSGVEIHISEYIWQSGDPVAYKAYGTYDPVAKTGAGLAIFQDRTRAPYKGDIDNAQPFFAGGATSTFEGTVYLTNYLANGKAPANNYWSMGTTVPRIDGGAGNIGIQLITDRLRIGGTGDVIINYDGRNKWVSVVCVLVE